MDRLEAMAMLVAVVEQGSFSAASRDLNVPLATLSRKVSDLEAQLGARLLLRTTRKLTLTDAGEVYLRRARHILDQVEDAEREAAGEFSTPKGELVIAAPVMFGRLYVLPLVAEFLAMYPDIVVRLDLSNRNVDLIDDHVDMAVRIGRLPDSSMVATQVGDMRTVTCAAPELLAVHGVPTHPGELVTLPCIKAETPLPSPGWRFRVDGNEVSVAVQPRLMVSTTDAALQAAILGVGFTRLLHYQVAEAVAAGSLQLVLESFEPAPAPVHLLHASRGLMPVKMRCFMDFAMPRLRACLN